MFFDLGYSWAAVGVTALYPLYRVVAIRDSDKSSACPMCGTQNLRFRTRCQRCGAMV